MKQLIKDVLKSLPPETNLESEAMQQHIADRIYNALHNGGDIKKQYHDYLLTASRYYNLNPMQILSSRQQPGMDIKHCIRYLLKQQGYDYSQIGRAEGINHTSVINSVKQVELGNGETLKILSLFV